VPKPAGAEKAGEGEIVKKRIKKIAEIFERKKQW